MTCISQAPPENWVSKGVHELRTQYCGRPRPNICFGFCNAFFGVDTREFPSTAAVLTSRKLSFSIGASAGVCSRQQLPCRLIYTRNRYFQPIQFRNCDAASHQQNHRDARLLPAGYVSARTAGHPLSPGQTGPPSKDKRYNFGSAAPSWFARSAAGDSSVASATGGAEADAAGRAYTSIAAAAFWPGGRGSSCRSSAGSCPTKEVTCRHVKVGGWAHHVKGRDRAYLTR